MLSLTEFGCAHCFVHSSTCATCMTGYYLLSDVSLPSLRLSVCLIAKSLLTSQTTHTLRDAKVGSFSLRMLYYELGLYLHCLLPGRLFQRNPQILRPDQQSFLSGVLLALTRLLLLLSRRGPVLRQCFKHLRNLLQEMQNLCFRRGLSLFELHFWTLSLRGH